MVRKYFPPKVDFKKTRPSKTIPDQSMSIQEIVRRFVRGIPVDIVEKKPVYVDQNDHDLEKLSRMDFGEKAEYAAALKLDAERLKAELDERQAEHAEREASEAKLKAEKAQAELDAAVEKSVRNRTQT